MLTVLFSLVEVLVVLVPILLSVAFITVIERKVIGSIQRRIGPNYVGYFGVLQPFADALKNVVKETIVPAQSNKFILYLAPLITLICALLGWAIIPFGQGLAVVDLSLGILYSIAVSSVGVLGALFAGWSANSKFSFVGGLRSTAQIISYELILTSVILVVVLITGTFNFTNIVDYQQSVWFIFPLLPLFIIWLISALAEVNRTPFDFVEAESELVSGFITDHSAVIFVFFFLAEYSNVIFISVITAIYFIGGYHIPYVFENLTFVSLQSLFLFFKSAIIIFFFVWVRASLPRMRYDLIIEICWLILLPLVIGIIIFIPCTIFAFDIIPF